MRCGVVLLVAVLSLGTGAAVPLNKTNYDQIQENFDLNQFLGTWFTLANGCDCPEFIKKIEKIVAISKVTLSTNEEMDKLIGNYVYDRNGSSCVQVVAKYNVQDLPGYFVFNSTNVFEVTADVRVIKTNYQEYALILYDKMKGMNQTKSVALYGRTRKLRKEINEEFKEFALRHGIPEDMTIFLPEKGACVPWNPIPESSVKDRKRRALGGQDEEGSGFEDFMNTTHTAGSCQLAPDAGPCFGYELKFYYNHSSMACQTFNYGGCLGNRNNFKSEQECLQRCRTVAACRLPMEPGPCKSIIPLWAFDSSAGACVPFMYSGCQGNGNKFYTKKECEEYCDAVPEEDDELLVVPKKV
ncbi:protein AMBP [Chiloscyllium plagiosum]|uniref:protein AMBP n=1 Tax=Chiloscyllium plagiosum TaxID=36176 RepID=UPI001CB7BF28|nr:protein AMBP [Chiloscyllium plagiosum]